MDDLRRFDLNLLVAFDALVGERSVTSAARRMGIGQPAMSNALARLRETFGDPLLIRTSSGMQPTGRALDLVEPVSRILAELREEVLSVRAFRPETDARVFRIGVSDQAEVALMPELMRAMAAAAPNVHLVIRSVEMRLGPELLATSAIDLAIGYLPDRPGDLDGATLYHESFVCLFDAEACGIAPPLSLDTYAALPHILVSLRGEPVGHIDELLSAVGRSRVVIYTTPHFLAVPFLLRGFRAVAAMPRRLAEHCAEAARLATCPVPLASPGYDVSMAWHRRTASDPAQRWLRQLAAEIGHSRIRRSDIDARD